MSTFFNSTQGVLSVAATSFLILYLFFRILKAKYVITTKIVTYTALCLALATILSNITFFRMPQGGRVTLCSMLFIIIISYWFGPVFGVLAGFINGLLQLMFDPYIMHPLQLLLDYPLSYAALGLAGLFRTNKNGLQIGFIFGAFMRFLVTAFSGFIFFSDYLREPIANLIYTVQYNISYIGAEALITLFIINFAPIKNAINLIKNSLVLNGVENQTQ
ncbi:MAG: energy-coupled thiamine transporter ThiT [Clostridiales bacterium]|nr:energy-coupled thiamine transporter ThiT [Clostridiales bacterium]